MSMRRRKAKFLRRLGILLMSLSVLMFTGCEDEEENQDPTVEGVVISPAEAAFNIGENRNFSASLITESGDTMDVDNPDIEWKWWSSDTTVFTVDESGAAKGRSQGEAFCIVEVTIPDDTNLKRLFTGRDSAFVSVFGF